MGMKERKKSPTNPVLSAESLLTKITHFDTRLVTSGSCLWNLKFLFKAFFVGSRSFYSSDSESLVKKKREREKYSPIT